MELLQAAFSAPNLILTLLFGLVLFYWLTVIVGALNIETFDVDVHSDLHVGADVDVHHSGMHDHVPHDIHHEVGHGGGGGNWFFGMLRFFNFGRVPFMVVMSILILSMWVISMACNHEGSWINPYNSFLLASLYFIPNVIVSAFVMKFLSTPLIPLFDKLDTHQQKLFYEGQEGTLNTDIAANGTGQVKLLINNSFITISAKTSDGQPLSKGDRVIVLHESQDDKCYIIEKSDTPHL